MYAADGFSVIWEIYLRGMEIDSWVWVGWSKVKSFFLNKQGFFNAPVQRDSQHRPFPPPSTPKGEGLIPNVRNDAETEGISTF